MTQFGKRIVGEAAFAEAVRNEKGGGSVFGTRVRGAIPQTPSHDAKRASEFGPRTLTGAQQNAPYEEGAGEASIEDLQNILAENPTFFDSLYEAELARDDGPRPEALRIFQVHEFGIKGEGRRDILDEINRMLGGTRTESILTAERMERQVEVQAGIARRTEENKALRDAPRLKALRQRQEDLDAVKGNEQEIAPALTTEGQEGKLAAERGQQLFGQGGQRYAEADAPAKPDGSVKPETQSTGAGRVDTPKATSTSESSSSTSTRVENRSTDEAEDWAGRPKADLEAEAEKRGLSVKGSGADGAVLKADLVKALEKDDRKAKSEK